MKFQEIPFTNHLDQTINVGDNVIAVASGRSNSVRVRKGVYLGRVGNRPSVLVAEKKVVWGTPNGRYQRDAKSEVRTVMRRRSLPAGRIYLTR